MNKQILQLGKLIHFSTNLAMHAIKTSTEKAALKKI